MIKIIFIILGVSICVAITILIVGLFMTFLIWQIDESLGYDLKGWIKSKFVKSEVDELFED